MKLAICQMNIIWEDKESNYQYVVEKIKLASKQKIDLFLLPEMSFTGFSMNTDLTKEKNQETVNRMIKYAIQYDIAIGFGWVKDCGEKSENHYTVIDRRGETVGDYVKIHPFSYTGEDEKFIGGNSIVNFQLENVSFSSFICYDLRFPEIFQIASKSANAILIPANWPRVRRKQWKCLLRARAIENQVYIIAINCVGDIGGLSYSGDSCIIDPNGTVLIELYNQAGILEYELKNDVFQFRNNFPIKKDRREDLYKELAERLYDCCY